MKQHVLKKRDRKKLLNSKMDRVLAGDIKAFDDFVADTRYHVHPADIAYICFTTNQLEVAKAAFEKILKEYKDDHLFNYVLVDIAKDCKYEEVAIKAAEKVIANKNWTITRLVLVSKLAVFEVVRNKIDDFLTKLPEDIKKRKTARDLENGQPVAGLLFA